MNKKKILVLIIFIIIPMIISNIIFVFYSKFNSRESRSNMSPLISSKSWDPEAIPVCTQNGTQDSIKICSDGNGGAIIVWCDSRNDFGDIYAQLINAQGICQWDANGTAVCTAYGIQCSFDICSDGNGGVIIVWGHEYAYDIYAQRIDATGNKLWDVNGVMIGDNDTYQFWPKICSDGLAGAIITWFEINVTSSVHAQRIDAFGSLLWTPGGVEITATDNTNIIDPQICTDGAGGAIIIWDDWRTTTSDIYAQHINNNGIIQWTPNGKVICSAAGSQEFIKICSDPHPSGAAFLAWADWRDQINGPDIYAQRIDTNGDVMWSPSNGVPVCTKNDWQTNIELCLDYQGGLIITWQDDREGGNEKRRIFAQRIAGGSPSWTQDGIRICSANIKQLYQKVCTNGSNGIFITWADYRERVYAQKLYTNGKIIGDSRGYLICDSDYFQSGPDICPSNNGTVIIAWEDSRGPDRDLYAQRINIEKYIPTLSPGISFGNYYILILCVSLTLIIIVIKKELK